MNSLENIKRAFMLEHPTLNRQVGNEITPLSDDEYREYVDEWTDMIVSSAFNQLRRERNALLASSDWTQVPDSPVDATAWATYRQELRDLPDNTVDPLNVTWPKPPR